MDYEFTVKDDGGEYSVIGATPGGNMGWSIGRRFKTVHRAQAVANFLNEQVRRDEQDRAAWTKRTHETPVKGVS